MPSDTTPTKNTGNRSPRSSPSTPGSSYILPENTPKRIRPPLVLDIRARDELDSLQSDSDLNSDDDEEQRQVKRKKILQKLKEIEKQRQDCERLEDERKMRRYFQLLEEHNRRPQEYDENGEPLPMFMSMELVEAMMDRAKRRRIETPWEANGTCEASSWGCRSWWDKHQGEQMRFDDTPTNTYILTITDSYDLWYIYMLTITQLDQVQITYSFMIDSDDLWYVLTITHMY